MADDDMEKAVEHIDEKFDELMHISKVEKDWAEVLAAPLGRIFLDRTEDNVRFIILKSHFCLCGYFGVPTTHPLSGCNYDALQDVDVHGGFTFAGAGASHAGLQDFQGWYWFGWDYCHYDDYTAIYEAYREKLPYELAITLPSLPGRKWTASMVEADSLEAYQAFKKFVKERA